MGMSNEMEAVIATDRPDAYTEVSASEGQVVLHLEDGSDAVDLNLSPAEATALMVLLGAAIAAASA